VFYFELLKTFLHQSLGYSFLNWMMEINFTEVYCQPAKNIFEATIFHCKNILKELKNNKW